MTSIIQTAAHIGLHLHCSASLQQNSSMAVLSSRGPVTNSSKLNQSSSIVLANVGLGTSSERRSWQMRNSSMSFNNGLSIDEPFSENEDDCVDSTVLEALEVKSRPEGFVIKMRDGRFLKCERNVPDSGCLPDYGPQPAIVLQLNKCSKLLLPIIVLELPCMMLIEALRNVPVIRPTVYDVMKDMIEVMGYQAKMVRIMRRVHEAYCSRLYLTKVGSDSGDVLTMDLRPSDAVNLAVRCKVPIQVNKWLAEGDGVFVVDETAKLQSRTPLSLAASLTMTNLDRPDSTSCVAAEEFALVRGMMVAALEERYSDAAKLRDELRHLRSRKKLSRQFKQI
ncbi:bifunctional nuclease 2 [Physcomitrium patens]|uniref:BFN domain-containing protein n=1 Tax=Physcomitrium patens TaxID=3218 RepID=A0A2K1IHB6_PHYPA|nr:bifunctional nuclease 2-like [Physcomitrium patens]XP_024363507.1 bifunctional nuclease 2-like [Physcomitrium patens]XP_024363509.1 bifunctional nuclease 2-like [Physcomitrium patens]XP_024363510.1 bifunctional nuclease 2-like [Physcomitrium patens]XP_024363511.1 bifunctional nuclease 2-like [Physcomitrium patens]XP_024363512.1 bifunctional nuclease 2-like [Physcomitrium patens]PNR28679.1 hypothetical protein PHYPA_029272 [Physcomitrium patens]|eukprot:XP_024363506.1 bifunctional nuclease 2-like [Physcomitrella patens]